MNINKLTLAGRFTRDPELTFTPKGTAVAKFGVAVNRKWRTESGEDKEEVTFVDVTAFGKTAEAIGQYFKKGREIYLEGRLKTETWDDKQTGQKRSKLVTLLESFQFVGPKEGGQAQPQSDRSSTSATTSAPSKKEPAEDDVPF